MEQCVTNGTYDVITNTQFVVTPIKPVKAGHRFAGWKLNGKTYQPGDAITLSQVLDSASEGNELKFEAQWETTDEKSYFVGVTCFDESGDVLRGPFQYAFSSTSPVMIIGTFIPEIEGYKYNADHEDNQSIAAPSENGTDDGSQIKLYYSKMHNVSYSWSGLPDSRQLYDAQGRLVSPSVPDDVTRLVKGDSYAIDTEWPDTVLYTHDAYGNNDASYTFEGWNDPSSGIMGDANVLVEGSWIHEPIAVQKYTVKYQYQGNVPENVPSLPEDATYVLNQPVRVAPVPSVEGYSFSGWSTGDFKMPEEDVTVTGTWSADFSKLDAVGVEKTYDGVSGSIKVTGTIDGDAVKFLVDDKEVDNSFVDVDQSGAVTVQVTRGGETWTKNVKVDIKPVKLTVETQGGSKVYDGDPLTVEVYTISGLVGKEKLLAHTTGTVTDVTSGDGVDNTYALDWNDPATTAKEGNYEVGQEKFGKLVVTEGAYEVEAFDYVGPYDGQSHGITVKAPADATVTYDTDNAYVNVTSGDVVVGYTVTRPNYKTITGSQTVTIKPATLSVKAIDASKKYGETDPELKYDVTQAVGNEKPAFTGELKRSAGENVGDYPIEQGSLMLADDESTGFKASNYAPQYAPGTFVIEKASISDHVTLDTTDAEKQYDGTALEPAEATAQSDLDDELLVEYSIGGYSWVVDPASLAITNVAESSDVLVRVSGANFDGYVSGKQRLAISKAPATITVDHASKVFGSADPAFTGSVVGLVAEGDLGDVTYSRTNSDENVGVYENALTAGYSANGNYDVSVVNGDFEIKSQTIEANDPSDVVYNGQEQKWVPRVTDPAGKVLVEGEDYTVSYSDDATNVGTVKVTVTGVGNYVGTVERTYSITPASAVVVVNDSSKKFATADPVFTGSVEGLFGADSLGTVAYSRTNASEERVGTYPNVLTVSVAEPNPNYTYTVKPGNFAIVASDANVVRITSDANGLTKIYNGRPSSISAEASVDGSTLLYSTDGGATWSEENPSFTDAGSYTVHVKATHEGYEETAPVSATIVINKAPATITVDDASKVFGSADPAFTGSVVGLVADGDLGDVTYSRTNADENVGPYVGVLAATYVPNDNYDVSVVEGDFRITPQAIKADDPSDVVYNGQEQEWAPTVTDEDSTVLVEGVDYIVHYSEDVTNVGTVTVTIEGSGNFAGTIERTYRITPAAAVIAVNGASKVYGDQDPVYTGEISGLIGNDSLGSVAYHRTNDAEAAGTYPRVLTATVENLNPNYTYTVEPGDFAIAPAGGNVVNATGITTIYDGQSYSVTATAGKPHSVLLYSTDEENWSEVNPTFTDAGTYSVYVKATNPNFDETPVVAATVVIEKALATITVSDASKVYDSDDPSFAGVVSGLFSTDSLGDISYSRANDAESAGVYRGVLTASVSNVNPNYTYSVVPGAFTIERADGNAANVEGLTKTYDAQSVTVTASADRPGSTLQYSLDGQAWSSGKPYFVDAGTYSVYVKATNPNFNDTPVVSAEVVINKAPAAVAVNDASKVFGSADPAFTGTVDGLVAQDDLGEVDYSRNGGAEDVAVYPDVLMATYMPNDNYEVSVTNGSFEITPQVIEANDPSDVVYNGREQKWTPKVTDPAGKVLVEGEDYTVAYNGDTTNAGSVTVVITGTGNYAGTVERTYSITPAAALVIVNDSSKKFDQADPAFAGSIKGLFAGDSLGDVTYSRTNDAEEVGSYRDVLTATVDNLNANYTYTVEPGDFTIVPSDANIVRITADAAGLVKTYDGQSSSVSAEADVDGSTLLYSVDGGVIWDEENPSFTDAGSYTVHVKATHEGYEETAPVSATIVINKAPATITVDDASKVFGSADPAFTGSVVGLVAEGDLGEINCVRPGGAENVGVYAGALTALYTPNSNYNVQVINGSFEITPQTIAANDPSDVVYNGREQKWAPTVTDTVGNVLVEGRDFAVTFTGDTTNVGTVTVGITGVGNYVGTIDRAYDITPAAATIRVNDASKTYGSSDPSFTGAIEGLFGADALGIVTYVRAGDAEDVGTYADVLTAIVENANPNYSYSVVPGSFTIEPADGNAARVDATGLTKVYDGQPVTVTAEADQPGSTLLFSLDGTAWVDASPSFTDAGTFTVYVKATNPNFADTATVSANVVISPAPVTITVDDASKTAGSADPAFGGSVQGLVNPDDLGAITYVRTGAGADEAVGVYADAITADYAADPNYAVTVVPGTFTIVAGGTVGPVTPTPATPGTTPPATPTPLPTPGTPPADNPVTPIVTPVVDALQGAVETVIGDNETPLAQNQPRETEIGDNETPLAGSHAWCWVHWYIILGIIVSVLYAACVALRRGLFSHKLKKYEDDLTGGGDPAPGDPSANDNVTVPLMPKGAPAGATLAAGLGE